MSPENETVEDAGMNIDEAAAGIASDIFGAPDEPEEALDEGAEEGAEHQAGDEQKDVEQPAAEAPAARPAPSSWAKETHEIWAKLPPEAQAQIEHREKQIFAGIEQYKGDATYGKQLKEVIAPYTPLLASQGIDGAKAVSVLLNTHYKLSSASLAEKQATLRGIAQHYGVDLAGLPAGDSRPQDPELTAVKEKLTSIESALTARDQALLNEAKVRTTNEVTEFASDPAHPYFDEVAEDIVAMINLGYPLKDAYEKAVWANPVTREKEVARIRTEASANLRETARKEAEAARKATGANVRSRDTRRAPTEPLGTMEDTMKSTLTAIRERAH